jgi:hypothetical protein
MKQLFVLLAVIVASLHAQPADARKSSPLRPDQIQISYVAPKNPEHQAVFELLKERRVLERFKELLSPMRLPRPLRLKLEGCDGDSNAWFDGDTITVCYEYMDDVLKNAPKETTAAGVTRSEAIVGPAVEVFLHEFGHAVFDYLKVPLMGREEDAADMFAAYFLLRFAKPDARALIIGAAYTYNVEASRPSTKKNPFADEHGLPAQRFYNILCIAYGADPQLFADAVEKGYLPKERAEGCEDEYAQVEAAMKRLILPYVDPARAKAVRARRWLKFDGK